MAEAAHKLSGPERAAVLLLTLGEKEAAEVLRHMGPKEVQKVGLAMAQVGSVSKEEVTAILDDFIEEV